MDLNERYVKAGDNSPTGLVDQSQSGYPGSETSVSDRRLGIDWGKFGSACVNSSMVEMWSMRKFSAF